jgi:hypothetical protein
MMSNWDFSRNATAAGCRGETHGSERRARGLMEDRMIDYLFGGGAPEAG